MHKIYNRYPFPLTTQTHSQQNLFGFMSPTKVNRAEKYNKLWKKEIETSNTSALSHEAQSCKVGLSIYEKKK